MTRRNTGYRHGVSTATAVLEIGTKAYKLEPRFYSGSKTMVDSNRVFASTQALQRFLANPRVTLPQLSMSSRQLCFQATDESLSDYTRASRLIERNLRAQQQTGPSSPEPSR